MNKKIISIFAIILGIVLVGGAWYWYWSQQSGTSAVDESLRAVDNAPSLQDVEVTTNPVQDKLPDLNPVEKANPFKYNNPFE